MLVVNMDQGKGLVNGSRGVVTDFTEDVKVDVMTGEIVYTGIFYPIVRFKNGRLETIKYHSWNELFVQQIPLRLAYALTIHKAQGATLDCALIDIGMNTFEYGQAYVALSRVKSLDSLYVHEVTAGAFRAHPLVKKFYSGNYEPPAPRKPEPAVSVLAIPEAKIIQIKGKKASYGFDDDKPLAQQASLKDYFGVPKPTITPVTESNKPARHGKPWADEEVIKMLMAIRKKKTEKEIAEIHERTRGGINSKLRGLAVDYYNNDNKAIEEIEKITGLPSKVIQDAIEKKKKAEE
jgi:hypothetical protein